jgi:tagatose-1,6-bisphosphate aldolase non-catalytic subunit AgaZ/GatZ
MTNEPVQDESTTNRLEEAVGMPIPDEHVGAFVAEVFEDAERSTDWEDIVDAMVAPAAREAWTGLSPSEQVSEVLEMANCYDREAVELLASIDVDGSAETQRETFDEAMRLRRNADTFRDGVAAAYASGHVDADQLVCAVEESDFDTDGIARREDELERVTAVFDYNFKPYGGTLVQEDDEPNVDPEIPETF